MNLDTLKKEDYIHGAATLKRDIVINEQIIRKKGECGEITAYLPEDDKFAVIFDGLVGPNNWFGFDSKEMFEEYFEYKLNE